MWCKIDDTVCSVTELAFPGVALGELGDAQNDSIESLNLSKKSFNSISESIMANQSLIKTTIQFKNIGDDSVSHGGGLSWDPRKWLRNICTSRPLND